MEFKISYVVNQMKMNDGAQTVLNKYDKNYFLKKLDLGKDEVKICLLFIYVKVHVFFLEQKLLLSFWLIYF
jgi:hypothetical protein